MEVQTSTGTDGFGASTVSSTYVDVENVLVAPASADDIVSAEQLYGKKIVYNLAIPKGDTYTWEDRKVQFFNQTFKVFGPVEQGIEELVPLEWHKKVKVERYG